MYWNKSLTNTSNTAESWIVTLDVLKCNNMKEVGMVAGVE